MTLLLEEKKDMSRNVWGHVCAKLNGPAVDDKRSSMTTEYEEYCKLYGEFETLASHFTRQTIPIKRQVFNSTTNEYETEFAFPLYCDMEIDEDAIDRQEKEEDIHKAQKYLYDIWLLLEIKMEELCDCDYVHLVSPWTRLTQSHYYNGVLYENIDVTNDKFIVPMKNIIPQPGIDSIKDIARGPTLIKSDLTKHHYKNALMEVIRNQ